MAILIGTGRALKAVINEMSITDKQVTCTAQAVTEDTMKVISIPETTEEIAARDMHLTMDLIPVVWVDQEVATDQEVLATAMEHKATTREVNMVLADTILGAHMDLVHMVHRTATEIYMTEIIRE